MIDKDYLEHKCYYTDGETTARWDGMRHIFWFWNYRNSIKTLSYVRHYEDDMFGFEPKSEVSLDEIYDPIIFS